MAAISGDMQTSIAGLKIALEARGAIGQKEGNKSFHQHVHLGSGSADERRRLMAEASTEELEAMARQHEPNEEEWE
jgi:hypothetical protein